MALEEQIREAVETVTRQLHSQIDAHVRSLAAQLGQAAATDRALAVREARVAAEAEMARRLHEAGTAAQAEATRRVDEALASARVEASRRVEDAVAAGRAENIKRIEEAAQKAHAEAAHQVETAVSMTRAEMSRRLDEAVAGAREETHKAAAARLAATLTTTISETQTASRQLQLADTERWLQAIRRLDGARSLSEILEGLAESAAREASRVGVMLLRGPRLQSWKLIGFGTEIESKPIDLPADQAGLMTTALRSRQPCATSDQTGNGAGLVFAALPEDRVGVAVPVQVGGEIVAVLYADDANDSERVMPSVWPEAIEMLARYAARCLEVLTVAKSAHPTLTIGDQRGARPTQVAKSIQQNVNPGGGDEDEDAARRYARLLVSEIKLYHEAAVDQGRREHDLLTRLRPEIDRARRLYDERVPSAIRLRADYFGQELVRTLANGDASLLGRVG